ncbi:MAG: glycosyltransferase, partial [Actinomycetota bacterium]|nr:glycosyltransferase [Actinomycetota bacterium]
MPVPDVAVLIVTYEHGDEIADCLDAALAQADDTLAVEVLVADNASRDDTVAQVAARASDGVQLLQMGSNRGFAAAVNAAFAASAAEYVLILNPDCVMDAGCAHALRDHLAARPAVALAAALLHDPDGTPQLHARRDVGLAGVLWAYT